MSSGARLPMHGRNHRPGGSDPIPGVGGGIQFDTAPQSGTWLVIDTTGSPGGGNTRGIDLEATGGDFRIQSSGTSVMDINSETDINIIATQDIAITPGTTLTSIAGSGATGEALIQAGTGASLAKLLLSAGDDAILNSAAGQVGLEAKTFVYAQVDTSGAFIVFDAGFNEIFRVDEDGDLHGKTGKALTFDL